VLKKFSAIVALVTLCAAQAFAQQLVYPVAPRGDVTDTYFGVRVADPYRWLEDIDSPQVQAWMHAEEVLTDGYLVAIPQRARIAAHLRKIANYEKISVPNHIGNRYFYEYNSGLQNQSVLYTKLGETGTPRVLIDPNTFSKDGTTELGDTSASWDARYIAYAMQGAGSDWQTWRVRTIRTGKDLPDTLQWSKFSSVSWLPDNRSFLYNRYPSPPGATNYSDAIQYSGALYNQAIYIHRLGMPQSTDTLFYADPKHKTWSFGAQVTFDKRYIIFDAEDDTSINNRTGYIVLADTHRVLHKLFWRNDAQYRYVANIGTLFYYLTTLNAPNQRIIAVDITRPQNIRTIVPEMQFALSGANILNGKLFLVYSQDAHSIVRITDLRGRAIGSVASPGLGTISGFDGYPDDTVTYYKYSGWTTPASIYHYDVRTGRSTLYRTTHVAFDSAQYETKEIFYRSKDGTRVPMMISSRKGLVLDGSHPTILYGYGGFDIPILPEFSSLVAAWLQMGGVYAVANIRGGSEYGEVWHHGGMLANKQHVFDDFIAAAQYLIANKYTSRAKLAVKGESNGGLLVGAVETQRPDLFGAALPGVGVLDMLRFDKFTIGHGWIPEYGCSTCSKSQFQTLYAYSPYHNVKAGTQYPPTLIMTADHDDRVFPAHSLKFAAAMQHAQAGANPILLRIETNAGHGGSSLTKSIEEYTDIYAFLVKNLQMELPPGF